MKKIAFILFLILLAACKLSTDPVETRMDSIFNHFNTSSGPGCAVAVIQNGRTLFKKGYGLASLEYHIRITTTTIFDICSLSKQFTGLAISTLVEEKKISLDDDIRKYLPDLPDFGKTITVRELLHHTSGLRDWPEALTFGGWKWEDGFTYRDIMNMVKHQKELDFDPGSSFSYSNTGYNLLAAIVEKSTGKSFRAWTDDNIFAPLGMRATHFMDDYRTIVKNSAASYDRSETGFVRAPSELAAYGSSSLFTSVDDLSKWAINLEKALAKKDRVYSRMLEDGILNNGEKVHYGFGLGIGEYKGLQMITHTGGWAGYRSGTTYFPDQQLAIITLSNSAEFDPSINFQVADYFLHDRFRNTNEKSSEGGMINPAIRVESSQAAKYTGLYKLRPGWLLTITLEKGQLMTQATNEDKFPMYPSSDSSYWIPSYHASLVFKRDHDGSVNQLEYKNIKALRIIPFSPAPAQLIEFTGTYHSVELASEYKIDIQEDKLFARQRRTGDFGLSPEEADSFFSSLGEFRFFRNATGQVAGFRLSGGRVKNLQFERRQ